MKVFVDKDVCVVCGVCIGICLDVFSMSDEGYLVVIEGEILVDL